MKKAKMVSRYRGIGDVFRKKEPVAIVSYDVCCRRTVATSRAGEEQVKQVNVRPLIDGKIQVLRSDTSLYSDELYTLRLEEKHERECHFYAKPVDVVAGRYRVEGHSHFRKRRPALPEGHTKS